MKRVYLGFRVELDEGETPEHALEWWRSELCGYIKKEDLVIMGTAVSVASDEAIMKSGEYDYDPD